MSNAAVHTAAFGRGLAVEGHWIHLFGAHESSGNLKASIGVGERGLNTSPKLGTYIPLPYLVVLPVPTAYFRERLGA